MRHPVIDKRLNGRLTESWYSRCTIQTVTYTTSASNQQVPSGGTDIVGMINIPCRKSPIVPEGGHADYDEKRAMDTVSSFNQSLVKLSGYFPSISTRTMRAVVDGQVYQIRGVHPDSENYSTELRVEQVIL